MAELNVFLFVTNIGIVLLCGALLPVMPLLTRKSFLFGVKVPPEAQNTDDAKKLKRNYTIITIVGGAVVIAAAVGQYFALPNYTIFSTLYFPLVLIVIQALAFVPNHRKALELKARLGWHVPEIAFADTKTSFTRGNLSAMPHFWYAIALAIVFVSFVIALVRYPELPDLLPTHWGVDSLPDAWSDKSLGVVLFMPLINLGTMVLMWLCGALVEKAKLQIDHKEPVKSFAQHKKYRHLMGYAIGVLTVSVAVTFAILSLQSVFIGFNAPLLLLLAPTLLAAAWLCFVTVKAGQGGVLLKVEVSEVCASGSDIAANNAMSGDKCWAWGMFYHNPNDPACFVGNRFGGDIGFNYSRLPIKIGVVVCSALLVGLYVWVTAFCVSLVFS